MVVNVITARELERRAKRFSLIALFMLAVFPLRSGYERVMMVFGAEGSPKANQRRTKVTYFFIVFWKLFRGMYRLGIGSMWYLCIFVTLTTILLWLAGVVLCR